MVNSLCYPYLHSWVTWCAHLNTRMTQLRLLAIFLQAILALCFQQCSSSFIVTEQTAYFQNIHAQTAAAKIRFNSNSQQWDHDPLAFDFAGVLCFIVTSRSCYLTCQSFAFSPASTFINLVCLVKTFLSLRNIHLCVLWKCVGAGSMQLLKMLHEEWDNTLWKQVTWSTGISVIQWWKQATLREEGNIFPPNSDLQCCEFWIKPLK